MHNPGVIALLFLSISTCNAESEQTWMTIAESLTSNHGPATVAYRLFSAPDFVELCSHPQPVKLKAPGKKVQVFVGEPFVLSALQVTAHDKTGQKLDKVPLTIEVEEGNPVVFGRQAIQNNWNVLTPLRAGVLRFRIRALCGDSPPWLIMQAMAISR